MKRTVRKMKILLVLSAHIHCSFNAGLRIIAPQWHPTPVLLPEKIPWTEEPGRLQSMGSLESDMTEWLHFPFSLSCIGEGNGNPLQCSCLENPGDGGAWWAAVYGVAQSQTQLKWRSSSILTWQIFIEHLLCAGPVMVSIYLYAFHQIYC